jgi:caspase domain-containing protein/TIR domain-containing protein
MPKAKIVVSYRRSDARAMAGRIRDRLATRFGNRSVYFDIDNIPFGVDFRTHIDAALRDADVLVAIIGPKWRGDEAAGEARIFQESDPVRVEIETALAHGIAIVPVLVEGAGMPPVSALPASLRDFSFVNAAEVDEGRDFHQHMERVERAIDIVLRRRQPRFRPRLMTTSVIAATVAVALGLAGWILAPRFFDTARPHTPVATQEVKAPALDAPGKPDPATPDGLRRAALVIGNANYQHAPKLTTPVNDATAMAQAFKSAGFASVITKLDVSNLDFKRALREFTQAAETTDIAVVYFSGHGMAIGDANYLVPVDATLAYDYDAMDEAVTVDRLMASVESVKRFRLLILDASRDNPFVSTMKRSRSSPGSRGLDRTEPMSADTLVAYAAKAGAVAAETDGPNSVLVTALLQNLFIPGLDIRIAFGRVRDAVLKATNNRQEISVYGSLGGATMSLVAKN